LNELTGKEVDAPFAAKFKMNFMIEIFLFEKEILLTSDETHTPMEVAAKTWWNGLYIAVLKKN
jgi:hypothetical protein